MKASWLDIENDKLEEKLYKDVSREYNRAMKDLKKEMVADLTDATINGKFDNIEAFKYDRAKKGLSHASKRLNLTDQEIQKYFNTFQHQMYEKNYLGTVFNLHIQEGKKPPTEFYTSGTVIKKALERPFTAEALNRLNNDTKSRIRGDILGAIMRGETPKELASTLQNTLGISKERAMMIGRTERTGISNDARQHACETAKELGIDIVKRWSSALDSRTRLSHQDVDGEVVEVDEKFSNGLKYPGDPTAPPEEVINCRCSLVEEVRGSTPQERASKMGQIPYQAYSEWSGKVNYPDRKKTEQPKTKLTLASFPDFMTNTPRVRKETQKLIDHINSQDGAIPEVVEMYNSLAELEKLHPPVPTKVTYTDKDNANGSVRTRYDGNLNVISREIKIPKMGGASSEAIQVHEYGHLIDAYARKGEKVGGITREYASRIGSKDKKIGAEAIEIFKNKKEEVSRSIQGQPYAEAKKKIYELSKNEQALSDIYDALSRGEHLKNGTLSYGHGTAYYNSSYQGQRSNADTKALRATSEIFANYTDLAINKPEYIEVLRRDKPHVVDAMEDMTKEILNKVGKGL